MDVCVPRCHQRNAKPERQKGPNESKLTWAGDVNDVRFKCLDRLGNVGQMPKKTEIATQIFFKRKRQKAALQLEAGYMRVGHMAHWSFPRPDHQKGQIAPPGKCLKLAAGVGHSIDFMERVGKIGHTHKCKSRPSRLQQVDSSVKSVLGIKSCNKILKIVINHLIILS